MLDLLRVTLLGASITEPLGDPPGDPLRDEGTSAASAGALGLT